MKTTKQQTSSVSEAVRNLRLALGESQQAFAYRMKTAIRTIARYETIRPPKGKALSELFSVATEIGNQALATVFRGALTAEMPALFGIVAGGNAGSGDSRKRSADRSDSHKRSTTCDSPGRRSCSSGSKTSQPARS